MSTNEGSITELARQAMQALGLGEEAAETAQLWARCLIQATTDAGVALPALQKYRARGATWFGFQTGSRGTRSDCGVGILEGRTMIRAKTSDGIEGVARTVTRIALSIIGEGGGDDWYFALDRDGDIEMSLSGRAVGSRQGVTGDRAVIGAMRSVLAVASLST
jgi:hypothetical protein